MQNREAARKSRLRKKVIALILTYDVACVNVCFLFLCVIFKPTSALMFLLFSLPLNRELNHPAPCSFFGLT